MRPGNHNLTTSILRLLLAMVLVSLAANLWSYFRSRYLFFWIIVCHPQASHLKAVETQNVDNYMFSTFTILLFVHVHVIFAVLVCSAHLRFFLRECAI